MMRLDAYLYENGFYPSRNKAAEACERGEVTVDGVIRTKPSFSVGENAVVTTSGEKYVSLGAYKLIKALEDFKFDVSGKVVADIGASTGGFTQAILERGAEKVYAVDVGKDLLAEKIKNDERVVVMDETNARYLTASDFPEVIDGAVVDCSFISLKIILPALKNVVKKGGFIIALIKPQFECGKGVLSKSGVLKSGAVIKKVVKDIYEFVNKEERAVKDFTFSPIRAKKNLEFLILIEDDGESIDLKIIENTLNDVFTVGK